MYHISYPHSEGYLAFRIHDGSIIGTSYCSAVRKEPLRIGKIGSQTIYFCVFSSLVGNASAVFWDLLQYDRSAKCMHRDNRYSIGRQARKEFRLSACDVLLGTQKLQMCMADVGNDADVRLGDFGEAIYLAKRPHPHLDDGGCMFSR